MKKLLIVLSVAVVAIIVVLVVFFIQCKKCNKPFPKSGSATELSILPLNGITLNNVPVADANIMVKNFADDQTSSHARTSIWLSKSWVDNIYRIIKDERGDGVRIYFAKRKDNQYNTVVIVSTYLIACDPTAETGQDHQDYYTHTDTFFKTKDAVLTENWAQDPDATLFNDASPCKSGDNCALGTSNDISCSNAYEAVRNFKALGAKQLINTSSEWFSLAFLKEIEDEFSSELSQSTPVPADGIRIYFAKHTQITTKTDSHKDRHAFIIVTTKTVKRDTVNYHQDNYVCYYHLGGDNGEQCLNNCSGTTLPKP